MPQMMRPSSSVIRAVECCPALVGRLVPRLLVGWPPHSRARGISSPSSCWSVPARRKSVHPVAFARPDNAATKDEEERQEEEEEEEEAEVEAQAEAEAEQPQLQVAAPPSPFLPRIGPFFRNGRALSLIRSSFVEAVGAIAAARLKNTSPEAPSSIAELPLPAATIQEERNEAGDRVPVAVVGDVGESERQGKKDSDVEGARPPAALGFSFSAAGFLFPYHLGVGQCLIDRGVMTDNTPLSGSSAGAIVCAVFASGVSMQDAILATKELALDCRENGTAFRLGAVLRGTLQKCLPDDAHIKCSGRIRVAMTQVFRSPQALLVNQFDSKEDLIDALHTSSFIPGYIAPRPVTMYKNRFCVDGGLTLFMPPTSAETTVRVCAFPAARLGLKNVGISPDCNPLPKRGSPRQLLNWALEPAADELLDVFFNWGYQDALVWVSSYRSNTTNNGSTNKNTRLQR